MTEPGYLSMAAVRRLTGLTERQIRYYDEKRLVVAERTRGGHRVYTQSHVNRLLAVKQLLGRGMTIEQVRGEFAGSTAEPAGGGNASRHESFDDRGLEDVKIYFGTLRRSRHDAR